MRGRKEGCDIGYCLYFTFSALLLFRVRAGVGSALFWGGEYFCFVGAGGEI